MIDVSGATVDDAEAAVVIGLVVGEAREADVATVFGIQRVVHLCDGGTVGFSKGRGADFVAGKTERSGIGRGDGDGVGESVGIVLKLSEEKEPVLQDWSAERESPIAPT